MVSVVDLLPHVQVVVRAGVEFERNPPHPVEHDEGDEHVRDVGEGPRRLLRDAGNDIIKDLKSRYENEMDCPGTLRKLSVYGLVIPR